MLDRLTAAEGLERYLHTKYVGQKRFSLEGGDSLIPLIDEMIQRAGTGGAKDVVIGMAHRGRMNVLVNTLGKPPRNLFDAFEGKYDEHPDPAHSGDVKYHLGFSSDVTTPGGTVHLALGFNPSHLEIIDPVVVGSVRARQTRRQNGDRTQVVPMLIHGDAAFAGQGVVMELFQMSQARHYQVGGTIHIVVNNQVGFTTSNPMDRAPRITAPMWPRSSRHRCCTSTATIRKPCCSARKLHSTIARLSNAMWSLIWCVIAATAITKPMNRPLRSR